VRFAENSDVNEAGQRPKLFRFATFELDVAAGELRKDGKSRPRMRDQALQILVSLLERAGEVVTRDELRERLWPADTFVDFDHGVNTAINQVRGALGDTAANPRFIQTLPRRGYRFLVPVESVADREKPAATEKTPVQGAPAAADTADATAPTDAIPDRQRPVRPRSLVLSDADDLPAAGNRTIKVLFMLLQLMYLIFYVICLARFSKVEEILNTATGRGLALFVVLMVTAAVGIPVRLYLLTASAFNYRGLPGKFQKLFPFLLVLDEVWALTPFLLVPEIGVGLAIACAATLLYLPFSQRSLLLMGAHREPEF
jgi:DNA-binding winged helix-turn-helix (wHTH) protein